MMTFQYKPYSSFKHRMLNFIPLADGVYVHNVQKFIEGAMLEQVSLSLLSTMYWLAKDVSTIGDGTLLRQALTRQLREETTDV